MPAPPLIAWVDAVGAVLLQPGERLTLGGPPRSSQQGPDGRADLPLIAPLPPVAGAVVRVGEGWAIEEEGELTALPADGSFTLGGAVRGVASVPNPLSPAAAVTLDAAHRPAPGWGPVRLERAVIAAGPVLVGPGTECHVRVRGATGALLFRATPDGWSVRGADPASDPTGGGAPPGPSAALGWRAVAAGDSLSGGGVSLRLEALAAG